jgi:hypothetical protein
MTTHELATTLERLKLLFGDNLKTPASNSLAEAATAFRELPDQNLRALLTLVRRAAAPQPSEGAAQFVSAGGSGVVGRIRAIRDGTAPASEGIDLSGLKTNDQLKEVLRAFQQPTSGTKADLIGRIRHLCVRTGSVAPTPVSPPPSQPDATAIEQGVAHYKKLEQDRQLSITDVRAGFAPLREYPKPVLEEISRRIGYTPAGSREDILERLLKNLEGIKMSQHRADRILTGTSG